MGVVAVEDALSGRVSVGDEVTVRGWVRTRRDSKQGLSFVNVHDGSCFDPIQVVADASLPNYQNVVLHLTAGCAVRATGKTPLTRGQAGCRKHETQTSSHSRDDEVEAPLAVGPGHRRRDGGHRVDPVLGAPNEPRSSDGATPVVDHDSFGDVTACGLRRGQRREENQSTSRSTHAAGRSIRH